MPECRPSGDRIKGKAVTPGVSATASMKVRIVDKKSNMVHAIMHIWHMSSIK
ncbi:MAG: hypothetical protein GF364_14335 [Candidatus Lokiarchaeota archaeon]|nr:hypothetical protein [Candidatus Lokiarchaeota archaeon]